MTLETSSLGAQNTAEMRGIICKERLLIVNLTSSATLEKVLVQATS